jgi:hypothetical protein
MTVIVTKLHRADHGELEARITVNGGETIPVTRRFGSWTTMPDARGACRHVLPRFAAILQERARPLDLAQKRNL